MTMTADTPDTKELKDGRVVAIAGPVVDVEFPPCLLYTSPSPRDS